MSLKQIIKQNQILENIATGELTLADEPLIYSVKYSLGARTKSVQFFRCMRWKTFLKAHFRSYFNSKTAVVVIVRFYVSPDSRFKISAKALKAEKTPAVMAFEICDYLLNFIEMLHKVLINSYKQIVKIDADKFYSNEPRTVFKFMRYEDYAKLQNYPTIYSKSQGKRKNREIWQIQPKPKGNATAKRTRKTSDSGQ